jgi:lysine biosynthesis protein LysW
VAFAYCPDCRARIDLNRRLKVGQPVTCFCCGANLVVVHLNPLGQDRGDDVADAEWEVDLDRVPGIP